MWGGLKLSSGVPMQVGVAVRGSLVSKGNEGSNSTHARTLCAYIGLGWAAHMGAWSWARRSIEPSGVQILCKYHY